MNPVDDDAAQLARLRAVIVDSEPAARRGVRLMLERDAEIEIVGEAATGGEATELMMRAQPGVAFLDVKMPGGDGFEVLARINPAAAPAVVWSRPPTNTRSVRSK